jgi:hypothetical protein
VPDNGTPGQPAPPDQVITTTNTNNVTNTYNYYNTGTVGGSARPPGTSGDNPYDGHDDGSGTVGNGDGDGAGGGGDTSCPDGATCDGTLPDAGTFEDVCTFGECAQTFYSRVQAAPMVSAVLGAGAAFPSGSCPTWTLHAFDRDYSLSAPMCQIWDQVSSLLSGIFLIIWAWVASRIVLSA